MFVDAHLHLDEKVDGTPLGAAKELERQLIESNILRGIVLHLEAQKWPVEDVSRALIQCKRLRAFINIHPHSSNAKEQLKIGIDKLGFIGLKLHPRLQEFSLDDEKTVNLIQYAGELNIPVLIDAFPDGTALMQGFDPLSFARVAQKCPNTKMIWAHMGGHHVFDFMMLAKRLPNVFLDCSYSLLYFRGSSVTTNMVYAMKSMKFDRIFYGSDYPDRSIAESLKSSLEILKTHDVSEFDIDKIMFKNAKHFFNWTDL